MTAVDKGSFEACTNMSRYAGTALTVGTTVGRLIKNSLLFRTETARTWLSGFLLPSSKKNHRSPRFGPKKEESQPSYDSGDEGMTSEFKNRLADSKYVVRQPAARDETLSMSPRKPKQSAWSPPTSGLQ